MSMEAKTNFLNSLSDEQLGFFYAHEYNSNLEDILQDELTVKQFNLFKQWKEEEQKTDVLMDKLSSIESLLETLSSRQEKIEEKLESIESNGMSNQMISKKIDMFEDFTARIAKLEATVVDKCLTGPVLDKLTEFELLFERTTNGIDDLQKKYESISTLIVNENKSIKEDLSIIMDRILRSDSHISPDVPLDAPMIDNSMNDGGSIFCVGGFDASDKPTRGVQAYDSKNNKWISLVEMNEIRSYPGLVGANGKLYAIGGYDGAVLDSAEVFDSSSGTWSSIAPMNEAAGSRGVAYSNGVIYAIGGIGIGSKRWNKAEKYDIKLDTWTELPSMTAQRSHMGCAVLDGMVYAVGGWDRPNHLSSCERYNPRLNKWEAIASMKEKRSGLGLCVLNEFLYAVGGYNNGKTYLASVERYDTNTNKWTKVAAMASPRTNLSVAIMDGLIYAIGGRFDDENLKSVEVYSPLLDEWSPAADLNEACGGGAAAWVNCSLDGLQAANKERKDSENAPKPKLECKQS